MRIVDELRHLDGIKGNFYISDIEYLAPATLHAKGKPASQIIYSNVKEIVEHEQYIFDTLWNRAIPAEQKLRNLKKEGYLKRLKSYMIQKLQSINIHKHFVMLRVNGTTMPIKNHYSCLFQILQ